MEVGPAYERLDLLQSPMERIQSLQEDLAKDPNYEGWDTPALRYLKIVSADACHVLLMVLSILNHRAIPQ